MKRNWLIIGLVVVVVLAVAAVFGLQQANAKAATAVRIPTATVRRGSLNATINAAGNVSALQEASIAFEVAGRVTQVPVQVGDKVKAGQVLMQLDTTDLQLALKSAQVSLSSAQANYDQTKLNVQNAVKTAQANLASAQASYDDAKQKYDQNPNQLIVAKSTLDKATAALQLAQTNYDAIAWRNDVGMTSQAAALQSATSDYQSALANYKITAAGINDTPIRTAQATLDNAKTALDQAQQNLNTSIRTAQAQVDTASVAVEQAQRNLAKATILAPFDGFVSAVNYDVGDTVGSAAAVAITDLSQLRVQVAVAEIDVTKLKVSDTAQMTLDAVPGKTYTTTVVAVGPAGTITQGVVNYPVTIGITKPDNTIKPGMTANLTVIVDHRDNVLLVPTRAVHNQGNQKMVTALYEGQQIPTPITIGLEGDQYVEVTSGLKEGDVILLQQTQTRQPNIGGGGIPLLGGLGGR